ncbi:PRTRC system ThiF family protein [Azonexus hydrophilus]|uniref:PRTRC system ThiF family protein n=1 Tax=Azonexus hydrophilus TaxID=418702 RepID=A0ABZ2XNN7_9RHOO
MEKFNLPSQFLNRAVKIAVIGAGGTGSQLITGLAQLHHAMIALGHPGGLSVRVIDDDIVSHANVGRQMFYPPDVGKPKAEILVNRVNMAMGTQWKAEVQRLTADECLYGVDLVVGCVDSRSARKAIKECAEQSNIPLWLDMGNRQHDGQVILGEVNRRGGNKRLPNIADLFPETCDPSQESGGDGPSCSLAEALEKQSLFVNRGVVLYALNMLFELFRYGSLSYHGVFVNLKTARTTPLAIDPVAWESRFGFVYGEDSAPSENQIANAA